VRKRAPRITAAPRLTPGKGERPVSASLSALFTISVLAAAYLGYTRPRTGHPVMITAPVPARPTGRPPAALPGMREGVWSRSAGAASSPAPRAVEALDRETAEEYARWFQALSDPTRIVILSYLSRQPGPVSVGTIVTDLEMGQSTVSHHLKALLDVGFVSRTRDRTARLYAVNHNCITRFPTAADVVMGRPPRGA
jgi:DNA-binding transcriptional ArsR family regulator